MSHTNSQVHACPHNIPRMVSAVRTLSDLAEHQVQCRIRWANVNWSVEWSTMGTFAKHGWEQRIKGTLRWCNGHVGTNDLHGLWLGLWDSHGWFWRDQGRVNGRIHGKKNNVTPNHGYQPLWTFDGLILRTKDRTWAPMTSQGHTLLGGHGCC